MNTKDWIDDLKNINQNNYGEIPDNMFLKDIDPETGIGSGWIFARDDIEEILSDNEEPALIGYSLNNLRDYHLMYNYHLLLTSKLESEREKQASTSAAYAYLELVFDYEFIRLEEIVPLEIDEIAFPLHQIILAGWWEEAGEIIDYFFSDLKNYDNIRPFFTLDSICTHCMAWFILRIAAKAFGYNISDDDYPKLKEQPSEEYKIYLEVIENWDTEDDSLVDNFVYLLCDLYILEDIKGEKSNGADCYETVNVGIHLYPYTALTWLKLREYAGLKVPDAFSHTLMKYPLAKRFKKVLAKPKELPFIKELTGHVLSKKPNFRLPKSFI